MTHIMLDLETWGKRPGCDIFNYDYEVWCNDHWDDTSDEFRRYPLHRDPETVQWWNNQSDEAQAAFENPVDLRAALAKFSIWIDQVTPIPSHANINLKLWANDPHFDVSILEAAYHAVSLPVPWHYRSPRSMKTATDLAGLPRDEYCNYGTGHHALHDAIAQAGTICKCYARLGLSVTI